MNFIVYFRNSITSTNSTYRTYLPNYCGGGWGGQGRGGRGRDQQQEERPEERAACAESEKVKDSLVD